MAGFGEEDGACPTGAVALSEDQIVGGSYKVERMLGRGEMGTVYRAHNVSSGARIALKAIHSSHLQREGAAAAFKKAFQKAAQFQHKNIATIYSVGDEGDLLFCTMEYLDGKRLRDLLRTEGRIDIGPVVNVMLQLCDALEYAHPFMAHGGLSPENILILADGHVKVTDFGLARLADRAAMATAGVTGKQTYMPPEQRKSATSVDTGTDMYALGAIFFEMLAGRRVAGQELVCPIRTDLPAECDTVLRHTLVPGGQRYATIGEMRQGLTACWTAWYTRQTAAGALGPPIAALGMGLPEMPGADMPRPTPGAAGLVTPGAAVEGEAPTNLTNIMDEVQHAPVHASHGGSVLSGQDRSEGNLWRVIATILLYAVPPLIFIIIGIYYVSDEYYRTMDQADKLFPLGIMAFSCVAWVGIAKVAMGFFYDIGR